MTFKGEILIYGSKWNKMKASEFWYGTREHEKISIHCMLLIHKSKVTLVLNKTSINYLVTKLFTHTNQIGGGKTYRNFAKAFTLEEFNTVSLICVDNIQLDSFEIYSIQPNGFSLLSRTQLNKEANIR